MPEAALPDPNPLRRGAAMDAEAPPALSRAQAIASQLERLILDGEFQPGERLNEVALAERMGLSRGPIREAIRILAGTGLVTAVPNRGVFVRQISVRDMLELYELRALLFGYAAEQAAEHLDSARRERLEALLKLMDQACAAGDGTAYYTANLHFHALILDLGGNRRTHQVYDDCVKALHLFRRRYFDSAGNMRRSNTEHRQIVDAIIAGHGVKARTVAQRHVLEGRQRLLSKLDESAR